MLPRAHLLIIELVLRYCQFRSKHVGLGYKVTWNDIAEVGYRNIMMSKLQSYSMYNVFPILAETACLQLSIGYIEEVSLVKDKPRRGEG